MFDITPFIQSFDVCNFFRYTRDPLSYSITKSQSVLDQGSVMAVPTVRRDLSNDLVKYYGQGEVQMITRLGNEW